MKRSYFDDVKISHFHGGKSHSDGVQPSQSDNLKHVHLDDVKRSDRNYVMQSHFNEVKLSHIDDAKPSRLDDDMPNANKSHLDVVVPETNRLRFGNVMIHISMMQSDQNSMM